MVALTGAAAPLLMLTTSPVASAATAAKPAYPKVTVVDARTGKPFDLATLADTKKATLLWFWAPT